MRALKRTSNKKVVLYKIKGLYLDDAFYASRLDIAPLEDLLLGSS